MLSDGCPIVHGIESSHLVHTHGRHIQNLSDLVHGNERNPSSAAMLRHVLGLLLSEVQERHDGRSLVVARILL